jgi:glycosyltransferase involved in cell wall biosynthesis
MKMCQAFAENGHEVILLAPNWPIAPNWPKKEANIQNIYDFYGVQEIFTIKKVSMFKIPNLPYIPGSGHAYGFLAALAAKKHNPTIIYGRNVPGCFWAAKLGLKIVFESHAPVVRRWGYSSLFKKLIEHRNFKRTVVVSNPLKKYYVKNYKIEESRILVAPNGTEEPSQCEPLDFAHSSRLQVGYIGHLYPGRGMEVISVLAKRCSWGDFHIVGGAESDIQHWKKQLENLRNTFFHGFVPQWKTERYRQSFDVVLSPYQRAFGVAGGGVDPAHWMCPLKLFEYMASGRAIVCSDLPVLRDILTHGKNALLCDPEDTNQWVNALTRLRNDPKLRNQLGRNAYEDFKRQFSRISRAKSVLENLSD